MIHKIKKVNLSARLIDAMTELIENGTWRQGDKLPNEIELSASFGVSRNIMREAMKILSNFGVLDASAGVGTFVSPTAISSIHRMRFFNGLRSNTSVEQIMETRLIIEPELAYYACLRITPAALRALQKNVKDFPSGRDEFSFHSKLAACSGNPILSNLLNTMLDQLRDTGYSQFQNFAETENRISYNDHKAILAAIEQRDPLLARRIMYDHLSVRINIISSPCDPSRRLPERADGENE